MYKKEIKYIDKEIKSNVEIKKILVSESHWHESIEILYILEGTVEVVKVDHTYRLNKGDLYIINSHDIHQIKNIGENNIVLQANIHESYFIETHGEYYEHMFECRYIKGYEEEHYIESKREAVEITKDLMLKVFTTNDILSKESDKYSNYIRRKRLLEESKGYIEKLANILIKEFEVVNNKKEKHSLDDVATARYYQFMRYLCVNYNKKISLEHIAKELNLNKFYVSHIIKERTGTSYRDLLKIFRIENAKRMLILTDMSIIDIAEENGFANSGSFINKFKEKYMITPKGYREKYKINSEREVSEMLLEDECLAILKSNIYNFEKFYKSVNRGEIIEINVDISNNKSYCNKMPRIEHRLIGFNGISDFKILDNNNIYKFNEERVEYITVSKHSEIYDNRSFEDIFKSLVTSIEINKVVRESLIVKHGYKSMGSLFDENNIETKEYYFSTFISNLNEYVIGYAADYIVTWDGENKFAILCLVNKDLKEDKTINLILKLNKNINKKIRVITSILSTVHKENIKIESSREREIERINKMPKVSIEDINGDNLSIKVKNNSVISMEITIKDN